MDVGSTIEYIRKNKGISLQDICGYTISRQTYYRIIHNQVDTSFSKVAFILERLHVSFDELLYISNNFKQEKFFIDMSKVRMYFESGDTKRLNQLASEYKTLSSINDRFSHLYHLIVILTGKLNDQNVLDSQNVIQNYLTNVETWTHYETVLFNNSMFTFSDDFIEATVSKALHNLSLYSTLRSYGNEGIRMFLNVVILFIDRKKFESAKVVINRISSNTLNDDQLFEKSCLIFLKGILDYADGTSQSLDSCHRVIEILNFLGSDGTGAMFQKYLTLISSP